MPLNPTRALLAAVACFAARASAQTWTRRLLSDPAALCIDGSHGAFYVKPGAGANATRVYLFQQAGGWAMSPADLLSRSRTSLGSTRGDAPTTSDFAIEDVLTGNATRNPLFSTWTSVYLRYCDGASRASDAAAPLVVNGTALYARGFSILRATLDALLAPGGALDGATDVVVGGGSAGGLGAILHADYVAQRVRAVNPAARVVAVAAEGLFGDVASIYAGRRFAAEVFARVAAMGNVTRAGVNAACWDAHGGEAAPCLFAAAALPFVATPTFVMNSFQDEWQAQTFLAPDPATLDAPGGLVEAAVFAPCTRAPATGCNATQYAQWRGLGAALLSAMRGAVAAPHGGFLHSCPTHGSCILGRCTAVRLASTGETAMGALGRWLRGEAVLEVDTEWPGAGAWPSVRQPNSLCPAP